jgi:hypothetical protein
MTLDTPQQTLSVIIGDMFCLCPEAMWRTRCARLGLIKNACPHQMKNCQKEHINVGGAWDALLVYISTTKIPIYFNAPVIWVLHHISWSERWGVPLGPPRMPAMHQIKFEWPTVERDNLNNFVRWIFRRILFWCFGQFRLGLASPC